MKPPLLLEKLNFFKNTNFLFYQNIEIVQVLWLLIVCFGTGMVSQAQQRVNRTLETRQTQNQINGGMEMIGNAIVGLVEDDNEPGVTFDPNASYNGFLNNGDSTTEYIDIDGDPNTFSSSSAGLALNNPECSKIVYAGLYWAATYYLEREPAEKVVFRINNTEISGDYEVTNNDFNPGSVDPPFAPGITANLVLVDDGDDESTDACSTLSNDLAINGNIAVIRRGNCPFTEKVINAQNAGAVAVIIVNSHNGRILMDGNNAEITIPAVNIALEDGNIIIEKLQTEVINATLASENNTSIGDQKLVNLPIIDARKQGNADFRNIKFKVPGGSYVNVTPTDVIYDGYANTATNQQRDIDDIDGDGNRKEFIASDDVPYVCYADVTDLIDQNTVNGDYFVADMNATIGRTNGANGAAGGWTLVVIYENPSESAKMISTIDGLVEIYDGGEKNYTFSGFQTLPGAQPVKASYGIAALEGDRGLGGDRLLLQGIDGNYNQLGNEANIRGVNPYTNFFNSSISKNHQYVTNRNPNSENTLGFDIDLFELDNPGNTLLGNDQTEANFKLRTNSDVYRVFFNAFAVEIVEPELQIIKNIYTTDGLNIGNSENDVVTPGQSLIFELEISNIGNEEFLDGSVRVTEILPDNIDFGNITSVPPGVEVSGTPPRTLIYDIPSDLLETDRDGVGLQDPPLRIQIEVSVTSRCDLLMEACSNQIQTIAYSTFTGFDSGLDGSSESQNQIGWCGIIKGESTDIFVDTSSCISNVQDIFTCGGSVLLTAGGGFDSYTWSGPNLEFTSTNSNTFIVEIPETGIYEVIKEHSNGVCNRSIERFNVVKSDLKIDKVEIKELPVGFKYELIIQASGQEKPFEYEFIDLSTGETIRQESNTFTRFLQGEYIVKVHDNKDCSAQQLIYVIRSNPLIDVADKIFVCPSTGELHPQFIVEDEVGKEIELNVTNTSSITWQQLDTNNCGIAAESLCPVDKGSCESDWIDICNGTHCNITASGEYRVVIETTTKTNNNTETYYFSAKESETLRTGENTSPTFKLYPNPSSGNVQISIPVEEVTVYSMNGAEVLKMASNTFSIASLPSGIYFVSVKTNEGISILKLVRE